MARIVLEPEVIEIPEPDVSHLVTEDDMPVDNIFSERQQRLLVESLYASWPGPPGEGRPFIALSNVGLFYAIEKPALVPDALVSLDVMLPEDVWPKRNRSYFVWQYGKPPEVVVEIVSNRVGGELDEKRQRYAQVGIPYYIVYDPAQQLGREKLRLFQRRGLAYLPVRRRWLPELGLGLTLWEGEYEGMFGEWLRWCDEDGRLLLTGAEAAEEERQRADDERQRAERLAAQLRALGVEPE